MPKSTDVPPLQDNAIYHFIRSLAYLSFYKQTPSCFFGNESAFPPVSQLNSTLFSRVIQGFSKPGKEFAPIEMKTVTQSTTDNEAMDCVRHYLAGERVIQVNFESLEFKSLVWTHGYRGQVLHHAAVYQSNYVVFVCANAFKFHYVLVVFISNEILDKYVIATVTMHQRQLVWYSGPVSTYDRELDLHHAIDGHTVQLWKRMAGELEVFFANNQVNPAHDLHPYGSLLSIYFIRTPAIIQPEVKMNLTTWDSVQMNEKVLRTGKQAD